ncbi:MAG: hypothetical protein ABR878_06800 [Roseiarcus sp.]
MTHIPAPDTEVAPAVLPPDLDQLPAVRKRARKRASMLAKAGSRNAAAAVRDLGLGEAFSDPAVAYGALLFLRDRLASTKLHPALAERGRLWIGPDVPSLQETPSRSENNDGVVGPIEDSQTAHNPITDRTSDATGVLGTFPMAASAPESAHSPAPADATDVQADNASDDGPVPAARPNPTATGPKTAEAPWVVAQSAATAPSSFEGSRPAAGGDNAAALAATTAQPHDAAHPASGYVADKAGRNGSSPSGNTSAIASGQVTPTPLRNNFALPPRRPFLKGAALNTGITPADRTPEGSTS